MVHFYVLRIKQGKKTLEEVPERWREAVRQALEEEEAQEEQQEPTGDTNA
jgi:hypothetical protein